MVKREKVRMGYWRTTDKDGKKTSPFHRRHEAAPELPPLNPLAPSGNATPESETRPPSFTRLQLRNGSASPSDAPASAGSAGDSNDAGENVARTIKAQLLAHYLQTEQEKRVWTTREAGEGAFMKHSKGKYACAPDHVQHDGSGLYQAITQLNVRMLVERADFIINSLMRNMCGVEYGYTAQEELEKVLGKDPVLDVTNFDDVFASGDGKDDGRRDIMMWQAAYTGISILLLTVALGTGFREIAIEQAEDPNWLRLLFIICVPAQVWLSLFFFQAIVGNIAQIIGPIDHMVENSKYYSGKAPKRIHMDTFGKKLPHVTMQMPVFKEGLRTVIEPTVRSIKDAISTYELQGGSANIFVNDDGSKSRAPKPPGNESLKLSPVQLLTAEEATERQEFYDEHKIGWVARPRHDPKAEHSPHPFVRPGKFKKASNMNYGLRISCRVEELMDLTTRTEDWTSQQEHILYTEAMDTAIAERTNEAWADGDIRIGDYILLIDSDTRVPKDCLLEAVSELEQCPEVGILQFSSGVMNVTQNFFENGISFFTNMIYTMIRFAVAGGDVAPFVGHNAFLRWSAMQKVAYKSSEEDGGKLDKFWSEETVSEDFDMSLRLQSAGFIVRLAAYQGDGFKEGVSLTVYDELARWEKYVSYHHTHIRGFLLTMKLFRYAYGCNELIFNPFVKWFTKGPFNSLFITFIRSNIPLASKVTIMAYIGTYYALACSWLLTLLNYFLIGFLNGWLDHYYIHSFRVYFGIVMIFTVLGNISLAVLRYRINEGHLLWGFLENLKWIPLLTVFLGGISLHISQAILCHFLSIPLEWGTTSKESEDIGFFKAMTRVLRRFKWSFALCLGVTGMMVTLAYALDKEYRITMLIAVWPMGTLVVNHFLLPLVLNPQLMTFTW
ncbi:glycosyl transferase family 2 [Pyrenophora seminiperda CCB06]|uniref:Glycosyl transferase family 2 n=1 Tax=Pyrenophora seminiperda CCB06 TaxID=1302712 RepID=A0A3M7LZK9_9PLEO|nr:glycosyl transferase family 2 [Pyrenophora seminiperda CCB06]